MHRGPNWYLMDVAIVTCSQNRVRTQRAAQQPSDHQLSRRQDIPQLCGKAKTGAAIQNHGEARTVRKGDERVKGRGEKQKGREGERSERPLLNRQKDASVLRRQSHWSSFVSTGLSLSFFTVFFLFLGCTNLQRAAGWHGGSQRRQVDVSALLPSLCLPKSLHNKARSERENQAHKHTHTLAHSSVTPTAVKMLMRGWQWSL